jgi:hypothetical protein
MYLRWRGEKKCSDCQRIVAYSDRVCAAQQDANAHRGPGDAIANRSAEGGYCSQSGRA